MLTLRMPTAPYWLDHADGLPMGLRIEVEPLTSARALAARNEAILRAAAVQREARASAEAGMPADPVGFTGASGAALAGMADQWEIEALARFGIRRWEGLAAEDGAPLPVNPATIQAFAAHPLLGPAFRAAYRTPIATLDAEGNASAPSSNGDGAGARSTATDAPGGPAATTALPSPGAETAPPS